MNILDLDDSASWEEVYSRFIRNDPYWSVIESALSSESHYVLGKILSELGISIEFVKSKELLSLRQRCSEHFKGIYTHVAAYHACRPTNIESYLSEGIIPANMEELIEKAKILFNDADAVTEAVKDMESQHFDYFDHGREKIGFMMSRTESLKSGHSHYLEYGSELFQYIANRIGEWAVQKLSEQGTPTLFKCKLPISWLDKDTTSPMAESYALTPLIQLLIRSRATIMGIKAPWPEEWPGEWDGSIVSAFLLKRPVPKELIINPIDMTPFMTEEKV